MCEFSYGESVRVAACLLKDAGNETPMLDAELLLQHILKKNRLELYLAQNELHDEQTFSAYFSLVTRRLCHEPLAYIIERKEFFGEDLVVSPACLIPRPDTETVVEECLKLIPGDEDVTILDLGTGSGAIALSILKHRPRVLAIASDISHETLLIAGINAKNLRVDNRLVLVQGDLFAAVSSNSQFNCIVSNPPYIRRRDIEKLASSVRDFEPLLALDADEDGLAFYRRIIKEAPKYLLPRGYLVLEMGFDQAADIASLADGVWHPPRIIKDLQQHDRCLVLQLRTHSEKF